MMHISFLLDQLVSRTPGGIGRYATNLACAMADTTPYGDQIVGNIARITANDQAPDIRRIEQSMRLKVRVVPTQIANRSWEMRLPFPRVAGIIHSPSLAAPYRRPTRQSYVVPTLHDVVPWSHPETMTKHGVAWQRKMLHLAWRFSPAVAVTTNAIAEAVKDIYDFGDRIFVAPAAGSLELAGKDEADWGQIASTFGLRDDFIITVGTIEPRKGIQHLVELSKLKNDFQVVHVGPKGWGMIDETGTTTDGFRSIGWISDAVLIKLYQRARCLVLASQAEGFGLPVVEAMRFGCPVVISSDPALLEVSGGLGAVIEPTKTEKEYVHLIQNMVHEIPPRSEQKTSDKDALVEQANRYSWANSARTVWQLHHKLNV